MENSSKVDLKITYGVTLKRLRELHDLEYGPDTMPITKQIKNKLIAEGRCENLGYPINEYTRIVPFINEESANYYATELVKQMKLLNKYPEINPKFEILKK